MTSVPADLNETVASIIRAEGIKALTLKDLRERLEAKYNMSFSSHQHALEEAAKQAMALPDIQKELARAKAERESGSTSGKGKKNVTASKKEASRDIKVKKPLGYPKAALGAYIIFGNDHREQIKAKNPALKNTDILKALGEMWNKLSDEEKNRYKKLAEEDRARFDREMEEYKAGGGQEIGRGSKPKAASKEGPKRPKNAYMFFSSDFRAKNPGNVVEVAKAASAAWEKITPEERKHYDELAAADKERYQREVAESS